MTKATVNMTDNNELFSSQSLSMHNSQALGNSYKRKTHSKGYQRDDDDIREEYLSPQ
jgi:hypothetical protein